MNSGISQTFHQIWLGNKPIPRALRGYSQTWRDKHPKCALIPFHNGMTATGDIVTEDLKLIERLFYDFRKVLRR